MAAKDIQLSPSRATKDACRATSGATASASAGATAFTRSASTGLLAMVCVGANWASKPNAALSRHCDHNPALSGSAAVGPCRRRLLRRSSLTFRSVRGPMLRCRRGSRTCAQSLLCAKARRHPVIVVSKTTPPCVAPQATTSAVGCGACAHRCSGTSTHRGVRGR